MSSNKFIYLLSFLSGFLCLSVEIFWMRTISFYGMSTPTAVTYALGMFLIGIAIGALLGRKICAEAKVSTGSIGKIYLLSGVIDLSILAASIWLATNTAFLIFAGLFLILSVAIRGMVFPIIHHIGASLKKSGREVSNVYFSNVLGSALAPILISYLLLDFISTQQLYLGICTLTLAIATCCIRRIWVGGLALLFTAMSSAAAIVMPEKLLNNMASNSYQPNIKPEFLLENKHGIITGYRNVEPGMENDILIYGNNAYDGRLNTDLFNDTNAVSRAYMLSTAHPSLEDVLVIGLSTGAWTKALAQNPRIKSITVVEINPAYIELIKKDPNLAGLLKDRRVNIIIDDGRKWLSKNPDRKFDLIIMNTSFHWRSYLTNLLSIEFTQKLNNALKTGGWAYYNATWSYDVFATAQKGFKHAYQHRNMVLASNQPIKVDRAQIEAKLCEMIVPETGEKVFKSEFECYIASYAATKNPIRSYQKASDLEDVTQGDYSIITDDNMKTEYSRPFEFISY